jgi:uridine kinase
LGIKIRLGLYPLISNIIADIENILQKKKIVLIAIDGVGGSGKTELAINIQRKIINSVIVQLDDFYSTILESADLQRLKEQVLLPLNNQREAKYQIYEWKTNSFSDWRILQPKGVVIIEGVSTLHRKIRGYFDIKIWINYPAELGYKRGVERDIKRDGIDNSEKWKNIWMPQEERYIAEEKPKECADYIIDGVNIFLE